MNRNRDSQIAELNLELISNPSEMKSIESSLLKFIEIVQDNKQIFTKSHLIEGNSFPLRLAVIDFECDPPKIFGILVSNRIYQVFIKSEQLRPKINRIIVKLLSLFRSLYLFCFSNHEIRFIKKILPNKISKNQPKPSTDFLKTLNIVNIQSRTDEGLIPALFSIGEKPFDDPLLRDNKKVDFHFKEGHYDLILEHNKSCLLSTLKLVKMRFLKLNLW